MASLIIIAIKKKSFLTSVLFFAEGISFVFEIWISVTDGAILQKNKS